MPSTRSRNRKITALIKISRPPTAASMLRTRKFPPIFKIGLVVLAAYMVWNFNHPNEELIPSKGKRDFDPLKPNGVSDFGGSTVTFNHNPSDSSDTNNNNNNEVVAGMPGSQVPGAIANNDPLASGSEVATNEKQQAIIDSLRRIRQRQEMMRQLQNELFLKGQGTPNGGSAAVSNGANSNNMPNVNQQAAMPMVNNMMNPSMQQQPMMPIPNNMGGSMMQSSPPVMPSINQPVMAPAAPVAPIAAAVAAPQASAPAAAASNSDSNNAVDWANMSLEDMMKMKVPDGGVVGPPAPARKRAYEIYGRIGDPPPFRQPDPDTKFDEKYGKLDSQHFPECQTQGKSHNVAFLKTHKTGSSTMSNIMLRFADRHNLTVGLPLEGHWELGGYPAYIDKRLIDPNLPTYNVLGHHFRYNKQKFDEFMPPDTKLITIIRSPVDNVESVFGFFQDQEPFMHWMEDIETTQRLGTFYAVSNFPFFYIFLRQKERNKNCNSHFWQITTIYNSNHPTSNQHSKS